MKPALLLGNAPIIATTDFSVVPRDMVTIAGVNRLWHREDPERQFVRPDIYCILDHTVEKEWVPEAGECRELVTLGKKPFCHHPQAVRYQWRTYSDRLPWPTKENGAAVFNVKSSPGFLFQHLLMEEYTHIALLGIEYSTRQLHNDGQPTHAHGEHGRFARIAATLDSYRGHPRAFWRRALHRAVDQGVQVFNLTPHKTPFHEIGFPGLIGGIPEWIRKLKQQKLRVA